MLPYHTTQFIQSGVLNAVADVLQSHVRLQCTVVAARQLSTHCARHRSRVIAAEEFRRRRNVSTASCITTTASAATSEQSTRAAWLTALSIPTSRYHSSPPGTAGMHSSAAGTAKYHNCWTQAAVDAALRCYISTTPPGTTPGIYSSVGISFLSTATTNNCISSGETLKSHQPAAEETHDVSARNDLVYQRLAENTLQCLHDQVDALQSPLVEELSLDDGTLTIQLGEGRGTFVMNKHYITRQIWYSSPYSGADYFEYTTEPLWLSTRTGVTVYEKLSQDLTRLTGTAVAITAATTSQH